LAHAHGAVDDEDDRLGLHRDLKERGGAATVRSDPGTRARRPAAAARGLWELADAARGTGIGPPLGAARIAGRRILFRATTNQAGRYQIFGGTRFLGRVLRWIDEGGKLDWVRLDDVDWCDDCFR